MTDIPRMTEIIHDAARSTIYAANCTFDEAHARHMLTQAIAQRGKREDGGTFCVVHEVDGRVEGMLILVLCRVYLVAHQLRAMDLLWYCAKGAAPGAGLRMLKAGLAWCGKVPGLVEVDIVPTDIAGDPRRVGRLLQRLGFNECGRMYRKEMA